MSDTGTPAMTPDARRDLCQATGITLNGKPARITGSQLDFAVVRDTDGLSCEWAWETVARIVAKGGTFKS